MKKLFLLIFFVASIYAGRVFVFDPVETMQYLEKRRLEFQEKFGRRSNSRYKELSFTEKVKTFREFQQLWQDFERSQEYLESNIPLAKLKLLKKFVSDITVDKNTSEATMDRELKWSNQNHQNAGFQSSNSESDFLFYYSSDDEATE